MDTIVDVAVRIARLSTADAEEIRQLSLEGGHEIEAVLYSGGFLDHEEVDWLAQIAMQGYTEQDFDLFRRQWCLARICWSQKLFPQGAEVLPRTLIKHWAQRQSITLQQLLQSQNINTDCLTQAESMLDSGQLVIDSYSLTLKASSQAHGVERLGPELVLELLLAMGSPKIRGLAIGPNEIEQAALELLRSIDS